MADMVKLEAKVRENAGAMLQTLRKQGQVPAVVYGHGVKPMMVTVDEQLFGKAYKSGGENTMLSLAIDGKKPVNVLIKDIQLHPLTSRFIHADFFEVRMDEAIEANIPLEFVGEAGAIRELGGILVRALDELEVSAFPQDLPHSILVDISVLKTFEDIIKVKDLAVSDKVKVSADPETVVALVEEPRSEAEIEKLNEKVEVDVTKVGKVDEKKPEEAAAAPEAK
jgi:large subunit ribosomal protein L25